MLLVLIKLLRCDGQESLMKQLSQLSSGGREDDNYVQYLQAVLQQKEWVLLIVVFLICVIVWMGNGNGW